MVERIAKAVAPAARELERERERSRDRDRDRDRGSSRQRGRDRSKDRSRDKSPVPVQVIHHSYPDRDREREWGRERDRERERSRDRERFLQGLRNGVKFVRAGDSRERGDGYVRGRVSGLEEEMDRLGVGERHRALDSDSDLSSEEVYHERRGTGWERARDSSWSREENLRRERERDEYTRRRDSGIDVGVPPFRDSNPFNPRPGLGRRI